MIKWEWENNVPSLFRSKYLNAFIRVDSSVLNTVVFYESLAFNSLSNLYVFKKI